MLQREEIVLISYFITILLLITIFVVVFFYIFQHRKNKLLIERIEQRSKFEREIANAHIEIQEETLKNMAWELHDNIGQLLSVANMQLSMLEYLEGMKAKAEVAEAKFIVASALQEVRSLSRTLNTEIIRREGLIPIIEIEMERIKRLKFANTKLEVVGEEKHIPKEDGIIIFRIVQEFLTNSIKHSRSKNILANITFEDNLLHIEVSDDGVGFDIDQVKNSSGLVNMKSRAKFIHADYSLQSEANRGTSLQLKYKIV